MTLRKLFLLVFILLFAVAFLIVLVGGSFYTVSHIRELSYAAFVMLGFALWFWDR